MLAEPNLPRRDALPTAWCEPCYIKGADAQDLCRLTGLSLDEEGMFLDLSRLAWWDYWAILWAWVGGNVYCARVPFPAPVCLGCHHDWPTGTTAMGFPIHYALDEIGGVVGCHLGGPVLDKTAL